LSALEPFQLLHGRVPFQRSSYQRPERGLQCWLPDGCTDNLTHYDVQNSTLQSRNTTPTVPDIRNSSPERTGGHHRRLPLSHQPGRQETHASFPGTALRLTYSTPYISHVLVTPTFAAISSRRCHTFSSFESIHTLERGSGPNANLNCRSARAHGN
jgi:hypothetical protein